MVLLLEVLPDLTMVVDLTVDGEDDGIIVVGEGLSTGLCGKWLKHGGATSRWSLTHQHRQC